MFDIYLSVGKNFGMYKFFPVRGQSNLLPNFFKLADTVRSLCFFANVRAQLLRNCQIIPESMDLFDTKV